MDNVIIGYVEEFITVAKKYVEFQKDEKNKHEYICRVCPHYQEDTDECEFDRCPYYMAMCDCLNEFDQLK